MIKYFSIFIIFITVNCQAMLGYAQEDVERYYSGHMMWGGGWGGWFLGPLMMIIWLGVGVGVVVLIVRALGGIRHHHSGTTMPETKDAREILKARFANGDITREEYMDAKKLLDD